MASSSMTFSSLYTQWCPFSWGISQQIYRNPWFLPFTMGSCRFRIQVWDTKISAPLVAHRFAQISLAASKVARLVQPAQQVSNEDSSYCFSATTSVVPCLVPCVRLWLCDRTVCPCRRLSPSHLATSVWPDATGSLAMQTCMNRRRCLGTSGHRVMEENVCVCALCNCAISDVVPCCLSWSNEPNLCSTVANSAKELLIE